KKYDFILIDSAPVLQSDLTEFLVVQADVGVLIIQGDRCLYNNLRRSVQILSRLRLTAISAVFNWGAPRNRSSIHRLIAKFIKPIENRLPSYLKKIG
ncbi:hypothetical protein H8E50_11545, partial [bacterium]|nr:hypothetical protein [bacterium]